MQKFIEQFQETHGAAMADAFARETPKRIAIVDDHTVVRAGMEALFLDCPDLRVVATGANTHDALALANSRELDVMVLDIVMRHESAVDVLEKIAATAPNMGTVIYSGYPEQQFALPLIRLGARGYVDKSAPVHELVDAVRAVAEGSTYFSKQVQSMLWAAIDTAAPPGIAGLTPREFQIFLRLAGGQTVTEIAAALRLTDVTVSSHRARVLQKLKLSSNSHLTRYAIDHHFLN
jgi:DNA-binding NarL/FixJ family response regulator